jgi:hypothetical protein
MLKRAPTLTVLALAGVLLSCDEGGSAAVCTIVTDGTRSVFIHERAHCNGWTHQAFQAIEPPNSFRHDFEGRLTVYQCSRGKQHKAPIGTVFHRCRSAGATCKQMWKARGVDLKQYASMPNYNDVSGCQFDE